jgi:hypothetical protein
MLISGWILLLGPKSGMINLIARDWFGVRTGARIYSFWGMVWVGTSGAAARVSMAVARIPAMNRPRRGGTGCGREITS